MWCTLARMSGGGSDACIPSGTETGVCADTTLLANYPGSYRPCGNRDNYMIWPSREERQHAAIMKESVSPEE